MKTGATRDKDIFKLRQKGITFQKIGEKFKISAERVRQLYARKQYEIGNHQKQKKV